ncbi:MAG: VanW family protein [Flavobacteriales bacterium]|nr:VanW family protein [Flavobacteriales bacterium]
MISKNEVSDKENEISTAQGVLLSAEKHSLIKELFFLSKVSALIFFRAFANLRYEVPKHGYNSLLKSSPLLAVSESDLWNGSDNPQNWVLTAGKVQNLRIASTKLNGLEIGKGEIFSFWKQIGNPNIKRSYVIGREIREGCIVPTKAGGLCQLSNALYDAALKANFTILERHRHTKIIKGSLAEKNRDATVKWNYMDLRFKSEEAFRIETELTATQLLVRFRGLSPKNEQKANQTDSFRSSKLNDCYSCGNFKCFKHPTGVLTAHKKSITTYVLDEPWPEYNRWILQNMKPEDRVITTGFNLKSKTKKPGKAKEISFTTDLRIFLYKLILKYRVKSGKNLFSEKMKYDERISGLISEFLLPESTHLVLSQNFLPFLFKNGTLGGRTYDVLMTRPPLENLQQTLDQAYLKYPSSRTLSDFRVSQEILDNDNLSLTGSESILTPHKQIADIFNNKSCQIDWVYPDMKRKYLKGRDVLFPGSLLARKGAFEIKYLQKKYGFRLKVFGKATESPEFLNDFDFEHTGSDPFENIGLVIYPAYIENQPRILLKALANSIPVIASDACGLNKAEGLFTFESGNLAELEKLVQKQLLLLR